MALVFDAATRVHSDSATSLTDTHTSTGSNLIGLVFTYVGSGDHLNSLTWASVDILANQIAKVQLPTFGFLYCHYVASPTTGSQSVIAGSSGGATFFTVASVTYTGGKQTSIPDASISSNSASTNSIAQSLTTIADNCWLAMGAIIGSQEDVTAGSNTTVRIQSGSASGAFAGTDSNAAMTPAGSYAQNATWTSADKACWIVVSIAPAVASIAKNLTLLGVG